MTRTILIPFFLLAWCHVARPQTESIVAITMTVDLGEDRGQNFGSLFEASDPNGNVVYGAGFAGLYNTRFRMDRLTLQFFIRGGSDPDPTFEKLPPPCEDGGTYLFDFDGRVYQFSPSHDRVARWWDDAAGRWRVDASFGHAATRSGEGKMRLAGKVLQFKGGEAWYDARKILSRPKVGFYHHFYYAGGHLVFFHNNRSGKPAFSRLYAVPWIAGDGPCHLDRAVTLDLTYPGETPFAIGQLGDEIINSSNVGGVYAFDGTRWRVLLEPDNQVSYQLYSMLNWYDKLLMAQYPTGNLFEYDGRRIRHVKGAPPVMAGVSGSAREAQTTCIYRGDLYVGVWPWAELWRYDAPRDTWHLVRRMFRRPAITDAVNHPWEDRIRYYNDTHKTDIVYNTWGQRVTGLVPMGDALYISVSAKGCPQRDRRLGFLRDDEVWNEYRVVHRMRKPGCAAAAITWRSEPTTLRFTVTEDRMVVAQDGRDVVSAPVTAGLAAKIKKTRITWAAGMFGPFRGVIRSRRVGP